MSQITNFITIEGVDGAGKSTFVPIVEQFFINKGLSVIMTREPGGTPFGESIREIALHHPMSAEAEAQLMFCARSEHLQKKIIPALEDQKVVICDRFSDSTRAYQGGAKGISDSFFDSLESLVHENCMPGLTLYFDVPVEVSRARLNLTGKIPDKFESQNDDFFQAVRDKYQEIAVNNPDRVITIDCRPSIALVKERVLEVLEQYYQKNYQTKLTKKRAP